MQLGRGKCGELWPRVEVQEPERGVNRRLVRVRGTWVPWSRDPGCFSKGPHIRQTPAKGQGEETKKRQTAGVYAGYTKTDRVHYSGWKLTQGSGFLKLALSLAAHRRMFVPTAGWSAQTLRLARVHLADAERPRSDWRCDQLASAWRDPRPKYPRALVLQISQTILRAPAERVFKIK